MMGSHQDIAEDLNEYRVWNLINFTITIIKLVYCKQPVNNQSSGLGIHHMMLL